MPNKALEDKIATAKKRFELCAEAVKDSREKQQDDVRFFSGDQWVPAHRQRRDQQGRACLTVNRIKPFFHQIANDQRQNRQAIKVSPVDDNGDQKTAEVIQGIIRHIEYDSDAETAYDTAFDGGGLHGEGYFGLIAEYESPTSFTQCIKIRRFKNPFQVYLDPNAQDPTGSDAEYGFVVTDMTKDEYEAEYPESNAAKGWDNYIGTNDCPPEWMSADTIRIVEYFYKEKKADTLIRLSDGSVGLKSQFDESAAELKKVKIVDERETTIEQVKWCKLNAVEELDSSDIPGRYIPIFRVIGDEVFIDGKTTLSGVVRDAKDPQRHYNFMISESANKIALSNQDPWIAAEGAFEGHEKAWDNAHLLNIKRLEYKPKGLGGEVLPPPHRDTTEPAIQAITEAQQLAADNIKATTGIFDASLGAKGNETSGRAILARQQEGDVANFHYVDNLNKARRQCGKVMLDWIPVYYDQQRVMRIVGEDGAMSTAPINKPQDDGSILNDMSSASTSYDVVMSNEPSFQTKRREASEKLLELSKNNPMIWQIAPDIIVQGLDIPYADKVAERFKQKLGIQDEGDDPNVVAQLQQQNQQLNQQHAQLNAYAQQIEQENQQYKMGAQVKQMEIESRERIELLKLEVSRDIAEITAKSQDTLTRAKLDADLNAKLQVQASDQAHQVAMRSAEVGHETAMADKGHQQGLEVMANQPTETGGAS